MSTEINLEELYNNSVKILTELLYNSSKLISVLISNNYYKYFNYERTNNIRYF